MSFCPVCAAVTGRAGSSAGGLGLLSGHGVSIALRHSHVITGVLRGGWRWLDAGPTPHPPRGLGWVSAPSELRPQLPHL